MIKIVKAKKFLLMKLIILDFLKILEYFKNTKKLIQNYFHQIKIKKHSISRI